MYFVEWDRETFSIHFVVLFGMISTDFFRTFFVVVLSGMISTDIFVLFCCSFWNDIDRLFPYFFLLYFLELYRQTSFVLFCCALWNDTDRLFPYFFLLYFLELDRQIFSVLFFLYFLECYRYTFSVSDIYREKYFERKIKTKNEVLRLILKINYSSQVYLAVMFFHKKKNLLFLKILR